MPLIAREQNLQISHSLTRNAKSLDNDDCRTLPNGHGSRTIKGKGSGAVTRP